MPKLNISKEELLERYTDELNAFLEQCDWISSITAKMVCDIVSNALPEYNIDSTELLEKYMAKVDALNVSEEEWRNKYGIPEILSLIHDIIHENY